LGGYDLIADMGDNLPAGNSLVLFAAGGEHHAATPDDRRQATKPYQ